MGFLNWGITIAIATACTLATSAVVIYTTQYLIKDHHNTIKKNQFKLKYLAQKSLLKNVEMNVNAIEITPVEKSLLQLDELLLKSLETLDTITLKPDQDVDKRTHEWMQGHCKNLQTQKRKLITAIQEHHQLIDHYLMKIRLPELLHSDDSCSDTTTL